MSVQLKCDLCGGSLTMKSGGGAVCTNCSMEYSMDILREKLGAPMAAVPAHSGDDFSGKLALAEDYLQPGSMDRDKAVALCDEVLTQDRSNQDAWRIKIAAELSRYRTYDTLNAAAKQIENVTDSDKRKLLAQRLCELFAEDPLEGLVIEKVNIILTLDQTAAASYIHDAIQNGGKKIQDRVDHLRKECIKYVKEKLGYDDPAMAVFYSLSSVDKMYSRFSQWMEEYLQNLEQMLSLCENIGLNMDAVAMGLKEEICQLIEELRSYMYWSSKQKKQSMIGKKALDELSEKVNVAVGPITRRMMAEKARIEVERRAQAEREAAERKALEEQRAAEKARAIAQYWQEHATEHQQLLEQQAQLQAKLTKIKQEEQQLRKMDNTKELTSQINFLLYEVQNLNFFQGKKKKEMEKRIQELTQNRSDLEQQLKMKRQTIQEERSKLVKEETAVSKKLADPLN